MRIRKLLLLVLIGILIYVVSAKHQDKSSADKHLENLSIDKDEIEYSVKKSEKARNPKKKLNEEIEKYSKNNVSKMKKNVTKKFKFRNVTIGDGICQSVDVRNSAENLQILKGCRIIEGYLQIVLIDSSPPGAFVNYSFPELREIAGYFLIYRLFGLTSLGDLFPNLEVIRGETLLTNYAFIIYDSHHLHEIGLTNLVRISRGGVRIEQNPSLCYTNSINWSAIVNNGEIIVKNNGYTSYCAEACPHCKNSRFCWNSKECQKLEPPNCHSQCLGNCTGPTERDCYVCKHIQHEGKCVDNCPPDLYSYLSRRCLTKDECILMRSPGVYDETIIKKWRPFKSLCTTECPEGYEDGLDENQNTICKKCKGDCRIISNGAVIRHISDVQRYRGTVVITGSIEFQISNDYAIMDELIDAFKSVEEITGYLKVIRSFSITSLEFFRNLRVIKGEKLDINNASVIVFDNPNLSNLFLNPDNITILNGRLLFFENPKLCVTKITKFAESTKINNYTDLEISPTTNGYRVACEIVNINMKVIKKNGPSVVFEFDAYHPFNGTELLSYLVSVSEVTNENKTFDGGFCTSNDYHTIDVEVRPNDTVNDTLSAIVTGLKPYKKYAAFVRTILIKHDLLERSRSGQSKMIYFTTDPAIPSIPLNVKAYALSDSEILLNWNPPENTNGPISYYIITGYLNYDDPKLLIERDYCKFSIYEDNISSLSSDLDVYDGSTTTSTTTSTTIIPDFDDFDIPELDDKNQNQTLNGNKTGTLDPTTYSYLYQRKLNYKKNVELYTKPYYQDDPDYDYLNESMLGNNSCCVDYDNNGKKKLEDDSGFHIYCHDVKSLWNSHKEIRYDCIYPTNDTGYDLFEIKNNKTDKNNKYYETFLFNITTSINNTFTIDKLKRFSEYIITISACGSHFNNSEMCSSVVYITKRTRQNKTADNIINIKINEHDDKSVIVSWNIIDEPNGLILKYILEYRNILIPDANRITKCVTYNDFINMNGKYLLNNLTSGHYELKIKTVSLAGQGDWCPTMYFSVGMRKNTSSKVIMSIIGTLIVLGIIITFICCRKYQKRKEQERLIASVNPDYIESKYVRDGWEVARENITIISEFGLGNFGMVYKGLLNNTTLVAIKTLPENRTEEDKNEFLNEASVMKNFSTFHIVKLLGVVSDGSPPYVIMELMENGDLKTYLRSLRETVTSLDITRIVRIACEIADGMAYLESKKYVHRDLAARNCMVSKDLVCKIGDFGMARDIYETDYYKIGQKSLLPIRWMAPENLSDGVFTSDSDVWSFGVVLYEILTMGELPYQGFGNEEVLSHVLRKGTLNIPRNSPEMIVKLMERCFKWRPVERPTFMEIISEFEPFVTQDFCEKSFYHSDEGVEIQNSGMKKPYHQPAQIRFHWGTETARWVREFEDNVTLLDQTRSGINRNRIFKNGFQPFGNLSAMEDIPLNWAS